MTDGSRNSLGWRVSAAEYLDRRGPKLDGPPTLTSVYVPARDGTRLAVDMHLPPGATGPVPAILLFTPYCRRFALAPGADAEPCPGIAQYRDFFPAHGYAVVAVDIRGTGASFGARTGMRSPEERLDYHDVVEWVAGQAWSTGAVGITGISYVGAAADFAASLAHPAIRAVMPVSSVWDTWGDMFYPGGLLYTGMLGGYGRMIEALDRDDRRTLGDYPYFSNPGLAGPAPVDADPDGTLLAAALREHAANFDVTDFITQLGFRGAALRHDLAFTTATMAPKTYLPGIPWNLPHYGVSGWMDGAGYTAGAISRFHALRSPAKRLLLGPWDHGARTHVSPERDGPRPCFELLAETLRFFDEHILDHDTGLQAEQPVHYFTMVEEAWHAADTFPPATMRLHDWALGPGGTLVDGPTPDGIDEYRVDHAIGSGRNTRYERIAGQAVEEYYPDWHGRDAAMARWTSLPLAKATELTGAALADLWVSADTPDAAIIVYLEDVAPDGATRYVTEGALRASCRAVAPPPEDHPHQTPYHPCTAEAQQFLVPGKPSRLQIALHPTSWLLRPGHRIRLALAGADRDHLARVPFGRSPSLRISRGGVHRSVLRLPLVPRRLA